LDKFITRNNILDIIDHDADVYDAETGKMLICFRKGKLKRDHLDMFYDNVIAFAKHKTSNRGSFSGSKNKTNGENPKIMTNIVGYFDKLAPSQKYSFKQLGMALPKITVRPTRFLTDYPDKYKKLLPLINDIDHYYKEYIPDRYQKQMKKARQTPCHIGNTSFTTITTNVNNQSAVHTDKGDDIEGFGNLTVIERGEYAGGETCFPQYRIGVDVRCGDILFMDVHQPHGNLPIVYKTKDAIRLSIVCYLRKSIWLQTKGKTRKWFDSHVRKTFKRIKGIGTKGTVKNSSTGRGVPRSRESKDELYKEEMEAVKFAYTAGGA
jgi:hypothetical protein